MVFIQPSIVSSDRTMSDVQYAMDERFKVSSSVRNFADGPGVLPEVDEIPVVETAEKNAEAPEAQPVNYSQDPRSRRPASKESLRPVFRR
jgi:hypothetical protein